MPRVFIFLFLEGHMKMKLVYGSGFEKNILTENQ